MGTEDRIKALKGCLLYTSTQLVEEDTLRLLDHGLEILSREKLKAAIALTAGEEKILDGSSCAFIYNPHPCLLYTSRRRWQRIGRPETRKMWNVCFGRHIDVYKRQGFILIIAANKLVKRYESNSALF